MTAGRGVEEAESTGEAAGTGEVVDAGVVTGTGEVAGTGGNEQRCAEVLVAGTSPIAGRPLTYRVPPLLDGLAGVGVRALVPLGPRTSHGVIVDVHRCDGADARPLRELLDIPDPRPLFSSALLALARRVAEETLSSLGDAVRCLVPPEISRRRPTSPPRPHIASLDQDRVPSRLGRRQRVIVDALAAASGRMTLADLLQVGGRAAVRRLIAAGAVRVSEVPPPVPSSVLSPAATGIGGAVLPILLIGDSEARRRWIVDAVAEAAASGMRSLVAVPETALVSGLAAPLRDRWGDRVAEFHSDMAASRHRAAWERMRNGEIGVVVGTRSALFAPLDRLGLIIVDEEQDPSYKADGSPRYHGRTVALDRGGLEGARVVVGSAAPSLEAFAAAADGRMRLVRLPPAASPVRVTVVDMGAEQQRGRGGILARPLLEAIRRHLRAGGRVALFVNRVGYARVLVCRECGRAVRCPRCEISMPYDGETKTIQCRICGTASPAPDVCPMCKGVALRWVGAGTARVLEVVRRLFPTLRTARLDRETARGFETVAAEFASGRIRLVVGTRLLLRARQLRSTLVGVVDADSPLYLPDFRAAERTFQDLRAVVSLASRANRGGGPPAPPIPDAPAPEAVIQTRVPEHPVFTALRTGREEPLYQEELNVRQQLGYPPFAHLARLIATSRDRGTALALAARAATIARDCGVNVLGPAPMAGGGGTPARAQCLLRSRDADRVRAAARAALLGAAPPRGSRLVADMDPREMS